MPKRSGSSGGSKRSSGAKSSSRSGGGSSKSSSSSSSGSRRKSASAAPAPAAKRPRKTVVSEGYNRQGNFRRSYSDTSYTYKNADGGRYYHTAGRQAFYKAPKAEGKPRQSYYQNAKGEWKAIGGGGGGDSK